jgi:hypothetical protein
MVKELVILAIILAGLFSGCIGEESIAGKYVLEEDHRGYFILYEDGTFNQWFVDGTSGSGTYRFQNNSLYMTHVPFGNVYVLTMNGTAFDNDRGGKYVKVSE